MCIRDRFADSKSTVTGLVSYFCLFRLYSIESLLSLIHIYRQTVLSLILCCFSHDARTSFPPYSSASPPRPVSYTHLDVYKRQGFHLFFNNRIQFFYNIKLLYFRSKIFNQFSWKRIHHSKLQYGSIRDVYKRQLPHGFSLS